MKYAITTLGKDTATLTRDIDVSRATAERLVGRNAFLDTYAQAKKQARPSGTGYATTLMARENVDDGTCLWLKFTPEPGDVALA